MSIAGKHYNGHLFSVEPKGALYLLLFPDINKNIIFLSIFYSGNKPFVVTNTCNLKFCSINYINYKCLVIFNSTVSIDTNILVRMD